MDYWNEILLNERPLLKLFARAFIFGFSISLKFNYFMLTIIFATKSKEL